MCNTKRRQIMSLIMSILERIEHLSLIILVLATGRIASNSDTQWLSQLERVYIRSIETLKG